MFHIKYQHILYFNFLLLLSLDINAKPALASKSASEKPPLQLASSYQKNIVIKDYWVSEKLDGVRGYWTGKALFTRSGNLLSPPHGLLKIGLKRLWMVNYGVNVANSKKSVVAYEESIPMGVLEKS